MGKMLSGIRNLNQPLTLPLLFESDSALACFVADSPLLLSSTRHVVVRSIVVDC
jgi:hypothetical protein